MRSRARTLRPPKAAAGTSAPSRSTTNRPRSRNSTTPWATVSLATSSSSRTAREPQGRLASVVGITHPPEEEAMTTITQTTEHRGFVEPDEIRTFDHGRLELLHVGGSDIGRLVL